MAHQSLHQRLLGQAAVVLLQNSRLYRYEQETCCDLWNLVPLAYSSTLREQRYWNRNWRAETRKLEWKILQNGPVLLERQVRLCAVQMLLSASASAKGLVLPKSKERGSRDLYCIMFQVHCIQPPGLYGLADTCKFVYELQSKQIRFVLHLSSIIQKQICG